MPTFRVSSLAHGTRDVTAPNWLSALGGAIDALGVHDALDRIACETLANGTILVRDVRAGTGWAVVPLERGEIDDEHTEELLIEVNSVVGAPLPLRKAE